MTIDETLQHFQERLSITALIARDAGLGISALEELRRVEKERDEVQQALEKERAEVERVKALCEVQAGQLRTLQGDLEACSKTLEWAQNELRERKEASNGDGND